MRKNTRKPFVRREEKEEHKINEKIDAREVRLVFEGSEPQVVSTTEALKMAE
jgi:translation initiation factor IF-3